MPEDSSVRGRCLCGGVSFKLVSPIREVIYCHCSQCRRQSGHVVAASAVMRDNLQFEENGSLRWYQSSATSERGFCQKCGSTLFWRSENVKHVAVMAGSLNSPTDLQAVAHIFVSDKGDYYNIDDGLPQHDGHDHGIVFPPKQT